jgi:hypothetical protein
MNWMIPQSRPICARPKNPAVDSHRGGDLKVNIRMVIIAPIPVRPSKARGAGSVRESEREGKTNEVFFGKGGLKRTRDGARY